MQNYIVYYRQIQKKKKKKKINKRAVHNKIMPNDL